MDYENNYTKNAVALDPYNANTVLRTFIWDNVANTARIYSVVQVGNFIQIYNSNQPNPSANLVDTIELDNDPDKPLSMASVNGYLIIATGSSEVTVLTATGGDYLTITVTTKRLQTRDKWGVESGVPPGVRPTTLDRTFHYYNLLNQGWPTSALSFLDKNGDDAFTRNPITHMAAATGTYPSEAELYHAFRGDAALEIFAIGAYNPWLAQALFFGTSEAPKGNAIIDVFNRGSSRKAHKPHTTFQSQYLKEDQTFGGITSVVSYAGRVFYTFSVTGTNDTDSRSPDLGTMVFFSQVASNFDSLFKCYSQNDPSAEDLNAPLDTDGGFVNIQQAGEILTQATIGQSLFVFASNGVWEINGGESGFSATNVNLSKTTSVGCIGAGSVINTEDSLTYWATGGIYQIGIDPVSLRGGLQDLTEATIQTLYTEIPYTDRQKAVGTYVKAEKQVRWLYRDATTPNPYMYNRELIFDRSLGAFYTNTIQVSPDDLDPRVFGYLAQTGVTIAISEEQLVVGNNVVIINTYADTSIMEEHFASGLTPYAPALVAPDAFSVTASYGGGLQLDAGNGSPGAAPGLSQLVGPGYTRSTSNTTDRLKSFSMKFQTANSSPGLPDVEDPAVFINGIGGSDLLNIRTGSTPTGAGSAGLVRACRIYFTGTNHSNYSGGSDWGLELSSGELARNTWYQIDVDITYPGDPTTPVTYRARLTNLDTSSLISDRTINSTSNYEDIDFNLIAAEFGFLYRWGALGSEIADIVMIGETQTGTEDVIVFAETQTSGSESLKYATIETLAASTSQVTASELKNTDFMDWYTTDLTGIDAAAYLLTGALTAGNSQSKKQAVYVTTYMELTDNAVSLVGDGYVSETPSSCFMHAQWEWTNDVNTGRWSTPQQIYRIRRLKLPTGGTLDYGYEVVVARSKVRGSGRALSLYFATEQGHDCHLYGWSHNITENPVT